MTTGPSARRGTQRDYGRWRAATLIGVYALMALHIAHWRLAGRTLAPLELNEVLYTLELGIVTAGFVFMALAMAATLVVGRFFCGWACHLLALQDLAAWLLARIGIRPKPVRSRVLLLVPVGAMLFMFVWPQVSSLVGGGGPSRGLHVRSDAEGWGSFVTRDFWRNLPGPWVAGLTFAVCGFVTVYVLGSRSFCTYACPYGVLFGLADRLAPGRIALRADVASCADCGLCTAACSSHIRVHQELTVFGKVVSPACLKDLDCVAACPDGALTYRWTKPAGFLSWRRFGRFGIPYDFTLGEDMTMAIVFLAALAALRGLYDAVPFLLAIALGTLLAFLVIVAWRLVSRPAVRFGSFPLKRGGRWTADGVGFALFVAVLLLLTAHSGFIRWHEAAGKRAYARLAAEVAAGRVPTGTSLLAEAREHLETCLRFGLIRSDELSLRLASIYLWSEDPLRAEPHVRRWLARQPSSAQWRVTLGAILLAQGETAEARDQLRRAAGDGDEGGEPGASSIAHELLGDIALAGGNGPEAIAEFEAALARTPENASLRSKLEAARSVPRTWPGAVPSR